MQPIPHRPEWCEQHSICWQLFSILYEKTMARIACAVFLALLVNCGVFGAPVIQDNLNGIGQRSPGRDGKPVYSDYVSVARWLVHKVDWATISTFSNHLDGIPFGSVEAISDGPPGTSTGRILLYIAAPMSRLGDDLEANPVATVTISEAQIEGHCLKHSAEWPLCAKVSLVGKLLPVNGSGKEAAKKLIFGRFPYMANWPTGHGFTPYELQVERIELIDFFGGAHLIDIKEYYAFNSTDWS